MAKLLPNPRVKLSRLRDVGWTIWDPIGLLPNGESWEAQENQSFADEYDNYLISAASQLRRGAPPEEVVEYLCQIEIEHMGLGKSASTYERAKDVVKAIHNDSELWTWPDANGNFE